MLSQEKIQKMVRTELYLQTTFPKDRYVTKYFKSDFVGLQRIKSLIVYFLLFVGYVFFDVFRRFYVEGTDMLVFDYQGYIIKCVVWCILIGVIVAVFASFVASIRYEEASKRVYHAEDEVDDVSGM